MAWDDTKVAQDDFLSADWNAMVTDQKTRGKINTQEDKRGSNCSGTNGAKNRVLTLSNTALTKSGGLLIWVNGLLQHSAQVTITHNTSGSTVLFIDEIFDTDYISVIYLT